MTRQPRRLHRLKLRTCEVCANAYQPTYSKQRTCGRSCGVVLRFGPPKPPEPDKRALDWPITAERRWLETHRKAAFNAYMLARYHADPKNWSTVKKRIRIFERDGWKCRVCARTVDADLPKGHPRKANVGHIIAKSQGGEWTDANLATLCWECNKKDGSTHQIPIQTHLDVVSF